MLKDGMQGHTGSFVGHLLGQSSSTDAHDAQMLKTSDTDAAGPYCKILVVPQTTFSHHVLGEESADKHVFFFFFFHSVVSLQLVGHTAVLGRGASIV